MDDWLEQIRWRLRSERALLRELALILLASLVVGLYFLEHMDARIAEHERVYTEGLAVQASQAAAEYMAAEDRISLTVLARRTATLAPVSRVELRDASGNELASSGPERSGDDFSVQRAVRMGEGEVVGLVQIWPEPARSLRQQTEAGFVLLALCLVALRIVLAVIYRRLVPRASKGGGRVRMAAGKDAGAGLNPDVQPLSSGMQESPGDTQAVLRVALVNHRHLEARYTPSLLAELLEDYRLHLEQVVELYGGRLESPPGERALASFSGPTSGEAAFSALCAGQLFLRLSRRLGAERKDAGRPALEFKLLVTTAADREFSWACCEGGYPGRVQMPERELVELGLDARVLYRSEQALEAVCDGESMRLQPVDQLAQRYQKLISEQAERLEAK